MENDIVITPEAKETKPNLRRRFLTIIIGLAIIGVIIMLVTTFVLPYDDNIVKIVGYDEIENNIPSSSKKSLSTQLYNQLKLNFDVPYRRNAVVANIRPETYVEDIGNINEGSFIIDIDEYQQTLQASLMWSDNNAFIPENVVLKCTTKQLSKYPEAMCYGMYTNSNSLSLYLPHEITLGSGEKVNIKYGNTSSDGIETVQILVESCGSQDLKNTALSAVKSWVDELDGFKSDDFNYDVPSIYNNCIVK